MGGMCQCFVDIGTYLHLLHFKSMASSSLISEKEQVVNELHKQRRNNFQRRHVIQKGILDTIQIDLVEMQPYSRVNKGYRYILTAIDIFSKRAYAQALKNKTAKEVANAMENIIQVLENPPKNIQSDEGKEFKNKIFANLMNQYGINHYNTYSYLKASIVERFNRTLKQIMFKRFSFQGNFKWINILDKLLDFYNNRFHRTIGMSPNKVSKANEQILLQTVYNHPNISAKTKFKVGDHVRISKIKRTFDKGYFPNWSTEIFTIKTVQQTTPITFILQDIHKNIINGCFYTEELKKTKFPNIYLIEKILKKKGDKLLVKWLGFPAEKATWISSSSIVT